MATKIIIGLSAALGDIIYYGNRKTGEVDEFIVDYIYIKQLDKYYNDELTYEYYDKDDAYICSEEDLQRNNLLGDEIFCSNEALRNYYTYKEKVGD